MITDPVEALKKIRDDFLWEFDYIPEVGDETPLSEIKDYIALLEKLLGDVAELADEVIFSCELE